MAIAHDPEQHMPQAPPLQYASSLATDLVARRVIRLALVVFWASYSFGNLGFSAVPLVDQLVLQDVDSDIRAASEIIFSHPTITGVLGAALTFLLATRSSALRPMLFVTVTIHLGAALAGPVQYLLDASPASDRIYLLYRLVGAISQVGYGLFLLLLAHRDVVKFLLAK